MTEKIQNILAEAHRNKKNIRMWFKQLKKHTNKKLDQLFHDQHDKVFDEINCLDCANCCSSISPTLYDKDIARISGALRMKPVDVVDQYLRIDEENDYVFRQTPCPFLMNDNCCSVYENRPKACREYPHTDRRRMYQIMKLTEKNCLVCPAVYLVVKRIVEENH